MMRLLMILLTGLLAAGVFGASPVTPPAAPRRSPPSPPEPSDSISSPIEFFRHLLAMSSFERDQVLASRSPQARAVLEAKLKEFEALPPADREARLQTMQLRWLLLPLMRLPPDLRGPRLSFMTDGDRALVEDRLQQWDALPPDLRRKILDNEALVRVFFRSETNAPSRDEILANLNSAQRAQMETNLATFKALSAEEQARIRLHIERFFELTEKEREKTLNVLGDAERKQMENALRSFARLPKDKRDLCLRGFQKFAGLSAEERAEFLKNAERWQAMSAQDRQLWRDLVARLQHRLPPLPHGAKPKSPPLPSGASPRPPLPTTGITARVTN